MRSLLARLAAVASLFCLSGAIAATSGGYHLLKKIPLGAADGGGEYFDYITMDASARRIYASHGTEVQVLNADTGAPIGKITGLKRCHGVALVPELGKGFISDGDLGQVIIFDLKSLGKLGEAKAEDDADSILYDAASKRVFVFNGRPKSATVIDPASGAVTGRIPLGGAPEQAVADGNGSIFDNLEDTNEVIAIDSRTLQIKSRWPVAPLGQPVSIALDRKNRRLFIAGRNPKMLAMMDADSGKIVGSPFPIGARVDTTVFDPATGFAAASTGDGTIHVFHEDSPAKLVEVETVKTEYGAKTMALDAKTHHLVVDTSDFDAPADPAAKGPASQPRAKPGTFHVLIYSR
jgi:DNA-binding beta-propeller fold protein YncE